MHHEVLQLLPRTALQCVHDSLQAHLCIHHGLDRGPFGTESRIGTDEMMANEGFEAATMEALGDLAKRGQVLDHLVQSPAHTLPVLDDESRNAATNHGTGHEHRPIEQASDEATCHEASLICGVISCRRKRFPGDTMRKPAMLLGLLILCGPVLSNEADRTAIEEVMHKYVWSVDSLDADGYVSVFTPDAVIDSNGIISKGHDEIRKVVTGMQARQAANRAEGKPAGALYHVISNERISFQGPTEATYQSYWQTMRKGADGRYATGGFGRSEDLLVKHEGKWLIRHRKLTVFTD
jgi:ketosteroid isomerase-like protein